MEERLKETMMALQGQYQQWSTKRSGAGEQKFIVHFIFDEKLRVHLGVVKDDENALIVQHSGT